jgi:hypothetical protein
MKFRGASHRLYLYQTSSLLLVVMLFPCLREQWGQYRRRTGEASGTLVAREDMASMRGYQK